eukprot:11211143-Lingulodinium_polyedra.AAC.1
MASSFGEVGLTASRVCDAWPKRQFVERACHWLRGSQGGVVAGIHRRSACCFRRSCARNQEL